MTTLFKKPCRFVAGAATIASLPPAEYPEIAIIGRSNVGKSSLINALTGQKALARTSQNPGHTQQLNFFLLAEKLMLVDMPGYGFARVSKQKKSEWDALIGDYLRGRTTLKRVLVLIDARRGVGPKDEEFMTLLDDRAASYQLVLTKSDELSAAALSEAIADLEKAASRHVAAYPQALATSSRSGGGIESLQEQLAPWAV